jgi:hypothetical protein
MALAMSVHEHGSGAPAWSTGIALGIGDLAGGHTGARIQSRLPDVLIRRLVGILVIAIGALPAGRPEFDEMTAGAAARQSGENPGASTAPLSNRLLAKQVPTDRDSA